MRASPLIECVPNFSEGRDAGTLAALRDAFTSASDVWLLEVDADADHHRSVYTAVGRPEALLAAVKRAAAIAVARIDLTHHRGEHPRMGAVDVIPFVPLTGADMDECVKLARAMGSYLADEHGVPVFLYAAASRSRPTATDVRRGAFTQWPPDFGRDRPHPTAGAAAVGARMPLVAFNVLLDSRNPGVARRIARAVRASSGGLPAVQARGFLVRGRAQVSMNLLDVDVTSPLTAFYAVEREAAGLGVRVLESEIVGLAPERALSADVAQRIRLAGDVEERILERRIERAVKDGRRRSQAPR